MTDDTIKVRLHGLTLFWLRCADGSGALAPPEHLNADGNVNVFDAFFSESYAHVFADGTIRKRGLVIGRVEDLEILTDGPAPSAGDPRRDPQHPE